MNINEFSYEFDVLASSYLHEGGFTVSDSSMLAFNEYEKSIYLTREQENLVLGLYSDQSSIGSFEQTEQLRRDLDNLLSTDILDPVSAELYSKKPKARNIVPDSQLFKLPKGLWFIVYEAGRYEADENDDCRNDEDGFPVEIVPVTYDTLHRIKANPFRGPNRRRALRLDNGKHTVSQSEDNYVEILPKYKLSKYFVKYIRRPKPIILTQLDGDLSIDGEQQAMGCELHDSLHRLILDGAVRMALSSRTKPSGDAESS